METKHTKGIWELRGNTPYSIAGFTVFTGRFENNKTIVRMPYGCPVGEGYEENKANAKLIATAPELLEQLKELLVFVKGLSDDGIEPTDEYLVLDCERVIKKATE